VKLVSGTLIILLVAFCVQVIDTLESN